jgi:hypothetical protein
MKPKVPSRAAHEALAHYGWVYKGNNRYEHPDHPAESIIVHPRDSSRAFSEVLWRYIGLDDRLDCFTQYRNHGVGTLERRLLTHKLRRDRDKRPKFKTDNARLEAWKATDQSNTS